MTLSIVLLSHTGSDVYELKFTVYRFQIYYKPMNWNTYKT